MAEEGKMYRLLGADRKIYLSGTPGTLGGRRAQKVYGRLDCSTALRAIRNNGGTYEKQRVFFADEKTALAAGFRPCGNCMRQQYREYMASPESYRTKFGL